YDATIVSITTATAMPTFQENAYADRPATDKVMKISSGAYATDDRASLAKTGRAIRLGSSVSPSLSLVKGWPTSNRFRTRPAVDTNSHARGPARAVYVVVVHFV